MPIFNQEQLVMPVSNQEQLVMPISNQEQLVEKVQEAVKCREAAETEVAEVRQNN